MDSLLFLALLAGLAWFWFDALRAQELAKATIKRLCQEYRLQLLDDTISLQRLAVRRDTSVTTLRFYLQRAYRFEFTDDGDERIQGLLLLQGDYPVFIDLPGYYERVVSQDKSSP